MPSTIREVALRAGVSVSTVSRVLNAYPFVSEDARQRVLEAMEELDYKPDVAARTMRTGTSLAVGFVISDISNPLFSAIAKGADTVLHPRGYSLVLANSQNDPDREAELISTLRQRRVDGIIVAVADERAPSLAERLATFPGCVLFDRDVPGSTADAVLSDHAGGLAAGLEHLAKLGHRRVAIVAGTQVQLGSRARVVAFRRLAQKLGFDRDRRLVRCVTPSRETGYELARELLALDDPPTALVLGHNQLAVGVLEALHERSVRIPEELSLVACDDVDVTRLHEPPIDVVSRDLVDLGAAAGKLLLDRLSDRDAPPRRLVLPTRFVPRASTAAPPRHRART
jgi:LacI family transcriptional regulator